MLHDELFWRLHVPLLKCKQMNLPASVLETQLGGSEFSRSFTVLPPGSVVRLCLVFGKGLGPVASAMGLFGPGVFCFGSAG